MLFDPARRALSNDMTNYILSKKAQNGRGKGGYKPKYYSKVSKCFLILNIFLELWC